MKQIDLESEDSQDVTEWYKNYTITQKPTVRSDTKRRYGLNDDDLDAMLWSQDGRCAICGEAPDRKSNHLPDRVLHIDHDHKTKFVRALLCGRCNRGLGSFKDDPELLEKAAHYLKLYS